MQARREAGAAALAECASALCQLTVHLRHCCEGAGGGCPAAGSGGRGSAAAVMAGHLALVETLCRELALAAPAAGCAESEVGGGNSLTAAAAARIGRVEPTEELVARLCNGQPMALQQHTHWRGGLGSECGACSVRDALLRFASAAAEARRLELAGQLQAAAGAVTTQAKVLLAECTVVSVPLGAAASLQHQAQAAAQRQQQQQAEADGSIGAPQSAGGRSDLILGLAGLHARDPSSRTGGIWSSWRQQHDEALVQGVQAWRRSQLQRLAPAEREELQLAWQQPVLEEEPSGSDSGSRSSSRASGASSSASSRCGSRQCGEGEDVRLDVSKQVTLALCSHCMACWLGQHVLLTVALAPRHPASAPCHAAGPSFLFPTPVAGLGGAGAAGGLHLAPQPQPEHQPPHQVCDTCTAHGIRGMP